MQLYTYNTNNPSWFRNYSSSWTDGQKRSRKYMKWFHYFGHTDSWKDVIETSISWRINR